MTITEAEMMALTTYPRWRVGFYTQKPWRFDWHRWRAPSVITTSPTDSPPRTFDAILSIGPLRWRIYREHPWNGNHIAFLSSNSRCSNEVELS
jgi:hypothetical protein